jgi:hypothetical protein
LWRRTGRRREALDQRLEVAGVRARKHQVGVTEAAVNLDRKRVRGVRLERVMQEQVDEWLRLDALRSGPQGVGGRVGVRRSDVEPRAVGRDRLEGDVAAFARARHLGTHVLAKLGEREAACDALFADALDPQHGGGVTAGEPTHLLPAGTAAGGRKARVEQQPLAVCRPEQRRRVLVRVGRAPALQDRLLCRLAAEQPREHGDRAEIGQARRDVRPLARVRALREEAAKLVERRRRLDNAVRVVVDERDLVQYLEKWPCCSNTSSPAL